jgi:hypothetical protein
MIKSVATDKERAVDNIGYMRLSDNIVVQILVVITANL